MVAKAEADKRNEEQLLGARPVDLDTSALAAAAPPGQVCAFASLPCPIALLTHAQLRRRCMHGLGCMPWCMRTLEPNAKNGVLRMQPEAVKLPTFYAEDTAASANEVWSRIHSDPLFAVRALLSPLSLPHAVLCLGLKIA